MNTNYHTDERSRLVGEPLDVLKECLESGRRFRAEAEGGDPLIMKALEIFTAGGTPEKTTGQPGNALKEAQEVERRFEAAYKVGGPADHGGPETVPLGAFPGEIAAAVLATPRAGAAKQFELLFSQAPTPEDRACLKMAEIVKGQNAGPWPVTNRWVTQTDLSKNTLLQWWHGVNSEGQKSPDSFKTDAASQSEVGQDGGTGRVTRILRQALGVNPEKGEIHAQSREDAGTRERDRRSFGRNFYGSKGNVGFRSPFFAR